MEWERQKKERAEQNLPPEKLGRGLWIYTLDGGLDRCGSASCRPGDPYGCSMIRARLHRAKTKLILDAWLAAGNAAGLGLYEIEGKPGVSLRNVMGFAQLAFSRGLGGGAWSEVVRGLPVAGQIKTLSVARAKTGGWIVRRWAIIGLPVRQGHEIEVISDGIARRWLRSLERESGIARRRHRGLRLIGERDVAGVATIVTEAFSPLDARLDNHGQVLLEEFGLGHKLSDQTNDVEWSPADLAAAYRENSSEIAADFAERDKRYRDRDEHVRVGLDLREDDVAGQRFGLVIRERDEQKLADGRTRPWPGKPRFRRFEVADECKPFVEYAATLEGVRTWSANRSSKTGDPLWNELVERASKLKPELAPRPVSKSPRGVTKK